MPTKMIVPAADGVYTGPLKAGIVVRIEDQNYELGNPVGDPVMEGPEGPYVEKDAVSFPLTPTDAEANFPPEASAGQ